MVFHPSYHCYLITKTFAVANFKSYIAKKG